MRKLRIGNGYDVHRLVENRDLIVGGVKIDHHLGLLGHSDADVLLHAITDAILGALSLGDIGTHFPDTSEKWKNADSLNLLKEVFLIAGKHGYKIGNIDSTIIAEEPKFNPHIPKMQLAISKALHIEKDQISIKATTNEKMGWLGRGEGIAAMAVVLMESVENS